MKLKWIYFYNKLKTEILDIKGNNNYPYLSVLQENTIILEEWIEKINNQYYKESFQRYSIKKINEKELKLYTFYFDWCNIEDEIYHLFKNEPNDFYSFIEIIYYTYDFLLSYNSLINSPNSINGDLYYIQTEQNEVLYECKFPPKIYDMNFKEINDVSFDYCKSKLLKEKGILRN